LFLGGHPRLVNKLRRVFPKWMYITDDELHRRTIPQDTVVFHWTGHCSHKLSFYLRTRLPNAEVMRVTATNMPRLLDEMAAAYESKYKTP